MKDNNSELKERISELELIEDNRRRFWSRFWGVVGIVTMFLMVVTASLYTGKDQGKREFIKDHQDNVCLFIRGSFDCMSKDDFSSHYKSKDEVFYDNSYVPNTTISKH